jgi:MFS family permease
MPPIPAPRKFSRMTTILTTGAPGSPVSITAPAMVPIGLLALAGFASGSGMRLLDPLLPLVADSLQVTVASTSVLIASFMLPYGLGQAVLGPLGDQLGKLRVVCVAIILYGIFVASCAAAPGEVVGQIRTGR